MDQADRKLRALWVLLAAGAVAPAAAQDIAIVGARVYADPRAEAMEQATVLVRDGRIAEVGPTASVVVPAGTTILQARGMTVTAGFWNSHVHLIQPPFHDPQAQPAQALTDALRDRFVRWGFTTLFDTGSLPGDVVALRQRISLGDVQGPRLLTVDMPFYPEHGTPIYVRDLWRDLKVPTAEVATPAQASARAARQLQAGADGVKLFTGAIVGGPDPVLPMPLDIARATVEQAHALGKPAFSHPTDLRGLQIAVDAGVDVLAHSTPDAGVWSADLVARLRQANLALVPTLTLFESEPRRQGAKEPFVREFVATAQAQVRALSEAGGQILFGTDAGFIEIYDPRREFELMAGAGMEWRQILASLTTQPAARFGHGQDSGRVVRGMEGDLVVLGGDPASAASALSDVRFVVRGGRVLFAADRLNPAASP
ncbi:MAG TPA: amidohydrolase family protein [Stenotrophomonas sp.]|jgi:imidazolonepropionase-like amidohydrolase